MKNEINNHPQRLGGIDPAALAAATLAAVLSISIQDGAYTPLSFVVGISIGILIFAYDVDPYRSTLQSVAFSSVLGLTSSLPIGYLLEVAWACLFKNNSCADIVLGVRHDSAINPLVISSVCVVSAFVVFKWDGRRKINRRTQVAESSTTSITTPTDAGTAVQSACEGSRQAKEPATL